MNYIRLLDDSRDEGVFTLESFPRGQSDRWAGHSNFRIDVSGGARKKGTRLREGENLAAIKICIALETSRRSARRRALSLSLSSFSVSFLAPSRALGRVGVPFQDLRRFNRAINLTPCCSNTSRRSGSGEVKISSAREGRNRARFDLSWTVSRGQWRSARLNHVLKGSNEHAAAGRRGGQEGQRAREEITAASWCARGNHKRREGPRIVGPR